MARNESEEMGQGMMGMIWRAGIALAAWTTLTACSVLLTTMGAIGLAMILNHQGVAEIDRFKVYVVWYALASPIAILMTFRWFR